MSSVTWYPISAGQAGASTSNATSAPKNELDKNAFLQLLVTQLKSQDPLQPVDNTQFIAQLAQFSALEQMTNVATEMEKVQQTSSMSAALQLLGTQVHAVDANGKTIDGTVTGVQVVDGTPKLTVGDQTVDLFQIQAVARNS